MKNIALKLVFFSIFYSLKAVPSPTATEPLSTIDNLVMFTPKITVGTSSLCQGVRVAKNLLATAPECVLKIRELSDYRPIGVHTAQDESLGEISDIVLDSPWREALLSINLGEESPDNVKFPELYNAISIPEQTFSFSIDVQSRITRQPVTLSSSEEGSEEPAGKSYTVSSEADIPLGSPVIDTHGRIVCILAGDSQCHVLKRLPQGRAKREVADYDDYPDDYDDLTAAEEAGITIGVVGGVALLSAAATGLFYLTTYMQAKRMRMPSDVFWPGILTLRYFNHCDFSSAIMALIGVVVCPFLLCPLAANQAASAWIYDYARSHPEQAPILQPPLPPQYRQ